MVIEASAIAGYLIAWTVGKARRALGRLDSDLDDALDAGLDKLHDVVVAKLGPHPVLEDLDDEGAAVAAGRGRVDDLTREQVELALTAAARKDEQFARAVTEALHELRTAERAAGPTVVAGASSQIFTGDAHAEADHGGVAIGQAGDVRFVQPRDQPAGSTDAVPPEDPSGPGRSRR
jgi:hypothetical protein